MEMNHQGMALMVGATAVTPATERRTESGGDSEAWIRMKLETEVPISQNFAVNKHPMLLEFYTLVMFIWNDGSHVTAWWCFPSWRHTFHRSMLNEYTAMLRICCGFVINNDHGLAMSRCWFTKSNKDLGMPGWTARVSSRVYRTRSPGRRAFVGKRVQNQPCKRLRQQFAAVFSCRWRPSCGFGS